MALFFAGALASAAAGCCNAFKAPNRCAACIYDNCVVPYGSRAAKLPEAAASDEVGTPSPARRSPVTPMAY